MKNLFSILFSLFLALLVSACGNGAKDNETQSANVPQENEPAGHGDESETIASLTPDQIKAVDIGYGEVQMKELTVTIRANGNLRVPNDKKANVTSLYGGSVKTIQVRVGDDVRKGQIIATLANPQFVQLQEDYLTTSSRILLAEQEFSRQQELFDNNAGARKNLQNAEAELKMLRTKKASLQKQIQLMGINAGSLTNAGLKTGLSVLAPISGTISNVMAQIGGYVDVSSPVAEIVDNASLHLDLNIFEKDLPRLKIGQIIHFTLTNNPTQEYDAEVFSIGAAFENESKTIPVHARVKGEKAGLIDGMNITGAVSLNNVLTPAVPNDAIVNADGKAYVFVLSDENAKAHTHAAKDKDHAADGAIRFEKVEVVAGVSDMGYTAITPVGNLPKGAKIVYKGAFFINAKLSNSGEHEH